MGEAYAFGVVWSFVFKALAMVVLRFKDRSPREFKVPLNIRVRGVEVADRPVLVFLVLLATATLNFLTKEVASVAGLAFTAVFLTTFMLSEHYHEKKRGSAAHQHLEQFNRRTADEFDPSLLQLTKPYRKLVAIRSSQNLFMLEKAILGDRSRDHRRRGDDGEADAAGQHGDQPRRFRLLRPRIDDGRGQSRRNHRQGSQAADHADEQPAVRHRSTPPSSSAPRN